MSYTPSKGAKLPKPTPLGEKALAPRDRTTVPLLCPAVSNLSQYFSPASVANSPARALLLVGVVLLAYWFLSLTLGLTFSLLHVVFGRFFWVARVVLFSMSCVYVLHKNEGEPENAILPLCFVVAVYFMTGPMGFYWRSGPSGPSVEEKLEHLENQVRLLNIRLNKVLESLDRANGK